MGRSLRTAADASSALNTIVARLRAAYGKPEPLPTDDALELVFWENAAYLLTDDRRRKVFNLLRERTGLEPRRVLGASQPVLLEIAKLGGMRPEVRVERWRAIAQIALGEFGGNLQKAVRLPLKEAKKALQRFPNIGEPGAEKILLFSKAHAVLGLESNGLRVLLRVGYGREQKSYSSTYRSVQEAIANQLPGQCAPLIQAHQLLRRHGMDRCKTSAPVCRACVLADICDFAAAHSLARNA